MSQFGKFLSSPPPGEEVVITGMSGKFPDSENIHEFQEHLMKKEDMVGDIKRRWDVDYKDLPQRSGILKVLEHFDPGFFGVHPRQANNMDPMMRMFMETTMEAIFDAGLHPSELEGTRTGVYVGAVWADAEFITLTSSKEPQRMAMTGSLRSLIAQRVAYYLKLKGPCFIADTACSSSLNALESAFKDMRNGRCDNAIVGGTNLILLPGSTLQFMKLGVLSKDGKCKVFDEEADGYVRSETIACILLQKAKNARRIYAQVIHVKSNCDGYKESGITFPSTEMQRILMTEAYEESQVHPNDLSYLEGHCTGTRVGDPQEIEAIDNVLGKKRDQVLLIGSIKSNVGHTEPSSGLCSIAKVLIAMESGLIPANLHLKNIKKGLEGFQEGRLKPVTDTTPFQGDQVIMGVNNFGFGGNNCHVILKRLNQKRNLSEINDAIPRLLCISGRTKEAVLKIFDDVYTREYNVEYIRLLQEVFKSDIKTHNYRGYAIVSNRRPIKTSINPVSFEEKPLHFHFGKFENSFKIIGRAFLNFRPFKESLKRFDHHLSNKFNIFDLIEMNERDPVGDLLGTVATQIGIGDTLKSIELIPKSTTGNSWGKLVSLYFEGIVNIKQVINMVLEIGKEANPDQKLLKQFKKIGANEYASNIDSNAIILNVSDSTISVDQNIHINDQIEEFLEIIGSFYQKGYNPQIQNLYPEIKYPVSRGTPMISPLIKWNHSKDWYTFNLDKEAAKTTGNCLQVEFHYSPFNYDHAFLQGHVVDGRNLFPATGYLFMVWKALSTVKRLSPNDVSIIFEDIQFVKAITYPKNDLLVFLVAIQPSGYFEITQSNTLAVRGRAEISDSVEISAVMHHKFNDDELNLDKDDIYKELNLRGYNYKGLFKSCVKANLDATVGFIKWEDDWIAFMDSMLQLKILQYDTRNLYVPVYIKRCLINPTKQLKELNREIPIEMQENGNIIKSEGVEIHGLQARSIPKKKPTNVPILEKYIFVENKANLSLEDSLRVNTQLILENCFEANIRALEIFDGSSDEECEPILITMSKILEGIPLINSDFTISTKLNAVEFKNLPESIKIEKVLLNSDNNYLLLVCSQILEDKSKLKQLLNCLKTDSFILTREDIDYQPCDIDNVEILTIHSTGSEKLILLRKKKYADQKFTVIEITTSDLAWISKLQKALEFDDQNVVIFSQDPNSGILGLANCVLRENRGHRIRCFFMMDHAPPFDINLEFYKNQLKKNMVINIYKNQIWGTYRHLLLAEPKEVKSEHCFVDNAVKGDISSLRWMQGHLNSSSRSVCRDGFVQVHYAALNFKDIMIASGRITADVFFNDRLDQNNLLGFEYAGVNLNGKRVMGMIKKEGLSTVIEADPTFMIDVPDSWRLDEAATIPVVYATVIYGLLMRSHLRPGMSILIHSATGGIGLAALNIATHLKCDIYVTVGTQEKRDFLKKHYPHISEEHISSSRDTNFEQVIKKCTKGRGVDVVLNSLAEEKLLTSVRCLARGGHFIEIGKFDLAQNNRLNLLLLDKEATFHGVMLDIIFRESTVTKMALLDNLNKGIERGYIKPLPRKIFRVEEVEDAFRYMAAGKHIGKVLIQIRNSELDTRVDVVSGIPRLVGDFEKSYVIIGGLGGFGLELADWLVVRGVRKLILSSRFGVKTGYQLKRIKTWQSYGAVVQISTSDVTTFEGCLKLLKEATELGPLAAIFNLGVVLKDALFENQTEDSFRTSLGPKAVATKYLDEITRQHYKDLKYFVVFSSISCGLGNASQSNYGMANSIMERICEKRKIDNLHGVAIEWGAIGDVGLVSQLAKNNIDLEIRGTLQQRISSCLDIIDHLIHQDESAVVGSIVVAQKRRKYGSGTAIEAVLTILGVKDVNKINRHSTLAELGLDSITATEIIHVLETDFDIYLTAKDIRTMTLDSLIDAEKNHSKDSESKIMEFSSKLMRILPDIEHSSVALIRMKSKIDVDDGSKGPVVFVFTGFEGSLVSMAALCANLYCIPYGIKYNFVDADLKIEEMAQLYLPAIEEKLIEGKPFNLICHSFGAIIGMEIAHLLESKGHSGNIFAIDAGSDYFQAYFRDNVQSKEDLETTLILELLAMFMPMDLILSIKNKLRACASFEERMNYAVSLLPPNLRKSQELGRQELTVAYKRLMCGHNYKFAHAKLKSQIYLFKATAPISVNVEHDYGWSKISERGAREITMIDGNHSSIIENLKLVSIINEILKV